MKGKPKKLSCKTHDAHEIQQMLDEFIPIAFSRKSRCRFLYIYIIYSRTSIFFWFQHPFSWKILWSNAQHDRDLRHNERSKHPPGGCLLYCKPSLRSFLVITSTFKTIRSIRYQFTSCSDKNSNVITTIYNSCCLFALHTPPQKKRMYT